VERFGNFLAGRLLGVGDSQSLSPARGQRLVEQLAYHRGVFHRSRRFHDRPNLVDLIHPHVEG